MKHFSYMLIFLSSIFANLFGTEPINLRLTKRQLCDLELLLNGGFSPLTGFMNQDDYENVVLNMRLASGKLWPMPITLDVNEDLAKKITAVSQLRLIGEDGTPLALLDVESIYKPNKLEEVQNVYGTQDLDHPGVFYILKQTQDYYVGGKITQLKFPKHYDFVELRKTPHELKEHFKLNGYNRVVAFQTRNPMHRAHKELTVRAAAQCDAHLLIQPVVGLTKPGDVDHFTRVKCYKKLLKYYPEGSVTLAVLPLSMRMAGPREAVWHALIRKNYGATHFIVGRDHAGPGKDKSGKDFYDPYAAQQLALKYADEIGLTIVPFNEMVFVEETKTYMQANEVPAGAKVLTISGTQLRALLQNGGDIPEWFTYPEIVEELRQTYPPKDKRGLTIFFTGLSGSGKSTLTEALALKLNAIQNRKITLLDGDVIRQYLSSELGFSKEHRSINVTRVGYVASEITKHGGICLCSLISPYEKDRKLNRDMISSAGNYVEIYVSTPLNVCESRDVKGLYKLAREGKIQNFTGISDPYEAPINPELTIDTTNISVDEALNIIINYLKKENLLEETVRTTT